MGSYQLYNVIFTFLPILVYAIMDRATNSIDELQTNVSLYVPGRKRVFFNKSVFCSWMLMACLQAAWLTTTALLSYGDKGLLVSGAGVFGWVILGANLTITRQLSIVFPFTVIAIFGSVAS